MKRDDDYIRELLLKTEEDDNPQIVAVKTLNPSPEDSKRNYHVDLLTDAGFMVQVGEGVYRLTNQGHDRATLEDHLCSPSPTPCNSYRSHGGFDRQAIRLAPRRRGIAPCRPVLFDPSCLLSLPEPPPFIPLPCPAFGFSVWLFSLICQHR